MSAFARAADHPSRSEEGQLEPESFIQINNPIGRLIRVDDRTRMPRGPLGSADLSVPVETASCVLGKGNVVKWTGVQKVAGRNLGLFDIVVCKRPPPEASLVP